VKPYAAPHHHHGGPDALGAPVHDFSTNSNACGPCPEALLAVQQADATRYPDPHYTALREVLAAFHGVAAGRIVLAGSSSEFIHRITALAVQQGAVQASLPLHSYGDYAQAAQARGLALLHRRDEALAAPGLQWACEPSSPLGRSDPVLAAWAAAAPRDGDATLRVVDCAYAPLRLDAEPWPGTTGPARGLPCWQLWTPNKALGLTGVRAAYAVAPEGAEAQVRALLALAPSWAVGAHGVALLQAWVQQGVQRWLVHSLDTLRGWKQRQLALCLDLGWAVHAGSLANYFCAQPACSDLPADLSALRAAGIKLRDATSFGLPGAVRMGVLAPAAQDALRAAWLAVRSGALPQESDHPR
jgi:histidinol-phosphate aminotransferase